MYTTCVAIPCVSLLPSQRSLESELSRALRELQDARGNGVTAGVTASAAISTVAQVFVPVCMVYMMLDVPL